jgi:NADH dehydrogenase FAD-containing subunit
MTEYEEYYHWKLARRAEREANKPLPVKHIVILGLGFGGLEALSEAKLLLQRMPARDRRSWKITVIERSSKWMGGWANQYVMTGRRSAEECSRLYEDCLHHDVATILQDEVVELNLEERKVICRKNGTIRADYLLVALGFQAQATPLVVDKMWNICDSSHAVSAGEAIRYKPNKQI